MAVSYGGVSLPLEKGEFRELLDALIAPSKIREFEGLYSAPTDLGHLPFSPLPPPKVEELGRLVWPRGAAKFAYAHFIVSDRTLALIRPLAYFGGGLNALTLTLDDGTRSVSASMSMLPPRPLSQCVTHPVGSGVNNGWLMTLVDDRYFWWYRNGSLTVVEGVTTWDNLYVQVGAILGFTVGNDAVSANYHFPTRRFRTLQQPIPVILDQIAYSCGQRVVRSLAGVVTTQNYATAKTSFDASWTALYPQRGLGGRFNLQNISGVSGDMFGLVPAAVRVVFPKQVIETGEVSDVYAIDTTLASLLNPAYPGVVVGFGTQQVAWGDQYAMVSTGSPGTPTNLSNLDDYATQFSDDWYSWQTAGVDEDYQGVGAWTPDGLTDTIEYTHDSERLFTRIMRSAWNDRAGGGMPPQAASGNSGGGGSSVPGVYGQANDFPALPGYGPHRTVDILTASPAIGDNLSINITNDAGNDRNQWELDNLGVWGRANDTSSPTYGPRRAADMLIDTASAVGGTPNLAVTVADGGALKDEIQWTFNAKGEFVRVSNYAGVPSATVGPRRRLNFRDDPNQLLLWSITDDSINDEVVVQPNLVPGDIVLAGGGHDWHYWRYVTAGVRHFNPWPVEYPIRTGIEYWAYKQDGTTCTDGLLVAVPYLETRGGTLDRIGIYVGSAAPSGAKVRLGIYRSTSATVFDPDTLVVDAGEILVSAAGLVEATIATTLTPSVFYYLAIRYPQVASASDLPKIIGYEAQNGNYGFWAPYGVSAYSVGGITGASLLGDSGKAWQRSICRTGRGALAALPATFPVAGSEVIRRDVGIPIVYVRYSA